MPSNGQKVWEACAWVLSIILAVSGTAFVRAMAEQKEHEVIVKGCTDDCKGVRDELKSDCEKLQTNIANSLKEIQADVKVYGERQQEIKRSLAVIAAKLSVSVQPVLPGI